MQDQPRRVIAQRKRLGHAGGREHRTIEVFRQTSAFIDMEIIVCAVGKQIGFILPAQRREIIDRLLARPFIADERQIFAHDLTHGILDFQRIGLGDAFAVKLKI